MKCVQRVAYWFCRTDSADTAFAVADTLEVAKCGDRFCGPQYEKMVPAGRALPELSVPFAVRRVAASSIRCGDSEARTMQQNIETNRCSDDRIGIGLLK